MGITRTRKYLGGWTRRKLFFYTVVVICAIALVSGHALNVGGGASALYIGPGMRQPSPPPSNAVAWADSPAIATPSMIPVSGNASSVPGPNTSPCSPTDLQVVGSRWAGAAGVEGVIVTLVNRSTVSCSIHQYPNSVEVEPSVGTAVSSSTTSNNSVLILSPQESIRIGITGSVTCSGQNGQGAVQAHNVTINGSETGNLTVAADQFTFTPACGIRTSGYQTTAVTPSTPPSVIIHVELPAGSVRPGTSFTYYVTLTNNTTQAWVAQTTCPTYTERLFDGKTTLVNESYALNCKAGPLAVGDTATYAIQMTIPSSTVANPMAKMTFEFPSFDSVGGGVVKIIS